MSGANNSSWCSNCKVFRDTDEFEVNKSGKRKKLCRRHSTKRKLDKLFDDWQTFETQIRSWSRPVWLFPIISVYSFTNLFCFRVKPSHSRLTVYLIWTISPSAFLPTRALNAFYVG